MHPTTVFGITGNYVVQDKGIAVSLKYGGQINKEVSRSGLFQFSKVVSLSVFTMKVVKLHKLVLEMVGSGCATTIVSVLDGPWFLSQRVWPQNGLYELSTFHAVVATLKSLFALGDCSFDYSIRSDILVAYVVKDTVIYIYHDHP